MYFKIASEGGYAKSMNYYGTELENCSCGNTNYLLGMQYLKLAADQKNNQ
jgi:hypothetical protein